MTANPGTGTWTTDLPIACNLADQDFARRGQAVAESIFAAVEETVELVDGYAFRFPADETWLPRLIEFVTAERRCCPFFTFEIACEPDQGPIWLRLRGPEGVKAFIRDGFVQPRQVISEP